MSFVLRMGVPEMQALWLKLTRGQQEGALSGDDQRLLKKLSKTLVLLAENPRHNGLQSHEIPPLSERYGRKVFQSYLENRTPAAGRLFWAYGPGQGEISILGLEPHPESATRYGYDRVQLSDMPPRS